MTTNQKVLRLSMSSIKKYMQCPMQWYFTYVVKLPQRTDYPRLSGKESHYFVASLYKKHSDDRKYWYKNINSARKAWFVTWEKALIENKEIMLVTDKELDKKYGSLGWICIRNYWNQNIDKPDPIFIEKKYTIPLSYGVELTGVFDQVRTVKLSWLKERRPEIFVSDKLSDDFNPYLIVDLKTGWFDYNIEKEDSDIRKVARQFSIQWDIQAAAYALIYKTHFKKYPAGFLLYQLRNDTNNVFLVKGDQKEAQDILDSNIKHVVDNIRAGSFPRNVTFACKKCDYYMECNPNESIYISLPGCIPESIITTTKKEKENYKQLKFGFKVNKRQ